MHVLHKHVDNLNYFIACISSSQSEAVERTGKLLTTVIKVMDPPLAEFFTLLQLHEKKK